MKNIKDKQLRCKLITCHRYFVPKCRNQKYCCTEHSDEAQRLQNIKKHRQRYDEELQEKKLTWKQREILDNEQREIDRAANMRMYVKAGLIKDNGRVLSAQERQKLIESGQVTYIQSIPDQRFALEYCV